MEAVYITGHRNPDTDSIVAAMAYAALKNALGQREYRAARLGEISEETASVLERFGCEPPMLLTNVRTQVRDLDYDTPPTLSAAATISRAWRTMQEEHLSTLPVAAEDGTLYGMLSSSDIATYDMSSVRNPVVGRLPVFNLLSALEGRIVNSEEDVFDLISGDVLVALDVPRGIRPGSIVICGCRMLPWERHGRCWRRNSRNWTVWSHSGNRPRRLWPMYARVLPTI